MRFHRTRACSSPPLAAAIVGIIALAGCAGSGPSPTPSTGSETRTTSPEAARAASVAAVSCSEPRVCDARQACVDATGPTTRALALKDEVSRKLIEIEASRLAPDPPEAQALPLELDEAKRLLREGHEKMDECDTKLTDLRAAYGF